MDSNYCESFQWLLYVMSIYKHLFSSNSVANTISKMQVLLAYRSEYCIAFIFRNIFRIQEVPIIIFRAYSLDFECTDYSFNNDKTLHYSNSAF